MPKFCGFSNTYLMHAVTGGGSLRVTTSSSVTAAKNTKLQSLTHSLQTSTMRIFTSDIFTRCSCLSVNLTYSVCTADCQVRKTWMLKSRNSACVEGHSQCESHTRARSCCCLHASTCSQVVTLTQALGRFGNNHDCPYQTCSSPDLQRDDVMDLQSAGTGSCFVAFSRKISTSTVIAITFTRIHSTTFTKPAAHFPCVPAPVELKPTFSNNKPPHQAPSQSEQTPPRAIPARARSTRNIAPRD